MYKGISRINTNKALKILLDQKYIGQEYKQEYRIKGIGPRYYLAPKAIKLLKDHQLNQKILLNMYKNKSVTTSFIDHNLDVMRVYINLRDDYPGVFNTFTKSELGDYDYFPEKKPDLYLHRLKSSKNEPTDYMLDIFTDTQSYFIKKRVAIYIDHYDSGDWEATTKTDYPTILIACPDSRSETSLRKDITRILDNMGIDELQIYTTATETLANKDSARQIWSSIYKPEKQISL